jgi:hypothetical protein
MRVRQFITLGVTSNPLAQVRSAATVIMLDEER